MVRFGFIWIISFAFFCINGGGAQDIGCSGNASAIADGLCDPSNNNFECGYDGGDCCECTCSRNSSYPCGFDGFDCRNPFLNDVESECRDTISSAPPCSTGYAIQEWVVNDTESARSLAETVNCTGGNFNVTWEGWVIIDRTIYVAEGTTMHLTGADSKSEVDGGGSVRLFTLANASLHIVGMSLSNGNASYGGAIAATTSNITLNNAAFKNNIASKVGGALYLDRSLLASFDGQAIFTGNSAGSRCGALVASRGSTASWGGQTSFSSNSAIDGGGAVCVNNESIVSWSDKTSFTSNSVNISSGVGGALVVDNVSHVSWSAETFFVNNSGGWGSAIYVKDGSCVSWSDETSLISNTGRFGGTVVILGSSNASWEAQTLFINNSVFAGSGGALYIRDASIVRWSGASSFIDNRANVSGGALSVIGDSSVYWSGGSLFSGNNAAGNGGAFFITNRSTVSWSAETSFVNNSGENGGALYINVGSSVFWAGKSSFFNNNARTTGGAVFGFESNISWTTETFFNSNTADVYGGAIAIAVGSRAFWEAPTTFYNNSASSYAGGAVLLYDNCSIFWGATTFFISNTAGAQGGALASLISSTVTMEGDTFFENNFATVDGGAAYIYHSDYQGQSLLNISNKALFTHNRCTANGGGIALIGSVFAVLATANMTFSGNIAGIAGGAVYVSGAVFGPKFVGTRFISNSAEMGGGVYTTGSGIALVPNILGVPEPQNPFTFVACQFIYNEASTRGGALDSGAGIDLIVDTLFVGNTAGSGGALRLAGEASLTGCNFIENSSGEDNGPAVYDEGVVSNMSDCRFIDNIYNCAPNRYFAYNEMGVMFDTVCKDCDAPCEKCDFEGKEPMCVDAIDHSISPGGNTTVELLLIEHGYWRASETSTIILSCYNPDACQGGVTGRHDYCLRGYEGPYCSVCSDKYTPSLGSSCNKCSDATGHWIALVVVLVVVIFAGFAAFLAYMLSGQEQDADRGIVARLSRFIPLHSLKIVIVVWQILTQFCDVANFVFPSIYQKFLDGVELLNFDFSWVISTRCIIDIDFHDRLLISTLGPIIGMGILGATFAVAIHIHRDSEAACHVVRRKHLSMVLLLTFLVYSSVSTTVFTMFVCDDLDDGTSYLRADYRIDCDSSNHDALEIYAGVTLVLYAIGIPAFYATLLFSNRGTLTKDRDRENNDSVTSFGDLWKPYKPRCFFYEVVECCRRVLLTGIVVFVFPDSAAQIAVAFIMATAFLVISEALTPYVSPWDTLVNRMGHVIVVTSLFLALLLKVDISKEETGAQKAFEAVLVAMHVVMVLVVIVEAGAMIMALRSEHVSEEPEPWWCTRRTSAPVGPLPGWVGSDSVEDEPI